MINALAGLVGIALILFLSEFLWRTRLFKSAETSRKIVHILVGIYIALWPLFMSFDWIKLLSLLLFFAVYASKRFHVFRSIHSVRRPTYGELLFPLGVLVSAVFAKSGWVYMAAVLHLSVADGLAAIIGVNYIKRFGYKVFGQSKTLIGSFTFYLASLFIIAATMLLDPASYGNNVPYVILLLPVGATFIENIGIYGMDNLLVPAVVIVLLNAMRVVA